MAAALPPIIISTPGQRHLDLSSGALGTSFSLSSVPGILPSQRRPVFLRCQRKRRVFFPDSISARGSRRFALPKLLFFTARVGWHCQMHLVLHTVSPEVMGFSSNMAYNYSGIYLDPLIPQNCS